MIKVYCNGTRIQCLRQGELTVGMVGAPVEFNFSSKWDGLGKTAVFTCDGTRDVILDAEGKAVVPHEILTTPGMDVEVGVYAVREDGTTWPAPTPVCRIGRVKAGADPSGDESYPPTPSVGEQLQNQINSLGERVDKLEVGGGSVELDTTLTKSGMAADAKAVGDALAGKQPKGDYVKRVNGVAPDASGNVNVTGNGGADGVSATHEWNGTVLTITSASGTSSADLKGDTGAKGDKGDPGTPGATGAPGADGKTPVRGTDYWTSADKQEIVDEVLENVPSGGGGGGDAIVDVIELPTENINEDVFYRLLTGSIIFNGASFSGWVCHCVASLPETGEMVYDGTNAVVYYNQQDGVGYGYVPDAMGSQMGIPAGWYPLDALAPGLGLAYGGAVTTADGTADDTVYILLEYVLYSYKEAWSPVAPDVDVIGWRGEGYNAEVFNDDWNIASGSFSHAEGSETAAIGKYAHAEGEKTVAYGERSHAEGANTLALGDCSHAEGFTPGGYTHVSGDAGATTYYLNDGAFGEHAVSTFIRFGSVVSKIIAVDQENWTITVEETLSADKPLNNEVAYTHTGGISAGEGSHAEGVGTFALGDGSHAEGYESNASGWSAHAEGKQSFAGGEASHAEGDNTIAASNTQHVQGRWNTEDADGRYAHIVGNGTDPVRSNAHTVDWNGVGWFAGGLKVGGTSQDDGASVLTEADMAKIVAEVLADFPNTGDAATGRRLDFIQSSGSQYINTGVIPNATTEIEMQYSVQSILSNGCHMLSNSNFYFPFPRSYNGEYSFLASRLGKSLKITLAPTVNTIYTIKAFPSNKVIINGTEYGTLEYGGGTSTEPLYMNTFGGGAGNAAYTAPAKLYYCKIWQDGALVRNFIPYNSPSGEVGMLDLVENKLYKSDGTAQFTAGNLMGYVLRSDSSALPNAEGVSF